MSVIVPVLNEAETIGGFLRELRVRAPEAEIIVADGGSTDGTAELAREFCNKVVISETRRSAQMNAAAHFATGDVLWFLHADSEVTRDCLVEIQNALADPRLAGGYFRIRLPRPELIYRATETVAHTPDCSFAFAAVITESSVVEMLLRRSAVTLMCR